jgi:SAM-dependent methyltransferase
MSWNVRDQDWLAQPTATSGSGPIDTLDGQVAAAMSGPGPTDSPAPFVQQPVEPSHAEPLPPPPPSAAFEQHERPSYESGAFVADSPAAEPPQPEAESLGFHIPTLSLGATARESASHESTPQAETQPPEQAPSEPAKEAKPVVTAAQVNEPTEGLVMPTLSRLKWVPAPSPAEVAAPVEAPPTSERREPGQPEVLEHVDSSELEVVAADEAESRQDAPAPEVDFVIPTLARPDSAERLDIQLESPSRSEMVIPTLMRAEPPAAPKVEPAASPELAPQHEAAPEAPEPEAPDAPDARFITQGEEVEEFEEVEADAIESLDAADIVESESEIPAEPELEEAKPRSSPPDAKPQQKRRKAWYDDVFAEHFMFLFPQTWEETAQRDAQFIHDQLGLSQGATVLDVGCGEGRHAIELAKLGLRVTGLDNSLAMLLAAAQHKEAAGIDDKQVTFLHGDMRQLPRDREFEAVICVGTTFGYFEEEQNRHCLQEMYDRLAVGGRLLLHVFNRDFVAPHLPSRSWWQGRRCMVIDEAEMNFFANRLRVHRTIIFDDGRQFEHFMFMRAYTVQDIGKAISQLGLRVVEVSGSRDTRARFYGSASPDIWIVAERK